MKRDGFNIMFPFAKRDMSEWGLRYEPKNIQPGGLYKVCSNPHVYQTHGSSCFITARAIGAHEALFN